MLVITEKTAKYVFKTGNIPPDLEAAVGRYVVKKYGAEGAEPKEETRQTDSMAKALEAVRDGHYTSKKVGKAIGKKTNVTHISLSKLVSNGDIKVIGKEGLFFVYVANTGARAPDHVIKVKAAVGENSNHKTFLHNRDMVLLAVGMDGGATAAEARERAGVNQGTACRHLKALLSSGDIVTCGKRKSDHQGGRKSKVYTIAEKSKAPPD